MPRGRFSKLTVEERKERKREQDKRYKDANREKIKAKQRASYAALSEEEKEERRSVNRAHANANVEAANRRKRDWIAANREQSREYQKTYQREYSKTEKGRKFSRISAWKQAGMNPGDLTWEEVYIIVYSTTHCEECEVELVVGKYGANRLTLDHNHETGAIRNVLCHKCNIRRG